MENNKNKLIVFGAIALVAGGVVTATILGNLTNSNSNSTSQNSTTPTPTVTLSPSVTSSVTSAVYKNGTFQATGTYVNPQNPAEKIVVSLSLDNGTVTAANVTTNPSNSTTRQYQQEFLDNYKAQVVGRKLDDIRLSKVSGSSLTSGGFNDAIGQIKDQAKA